MISVWECLVDNCYVRKFVVLHVPFLLAYGDTPFKLKSLQAFGVHKKGVWQWHFSCCRFPASGYLGIPKYCKRAKGENDQSNLFYSPPHYVYFQSSKQSCLWKTLFFMRSSSTNPPVQEVCSWRMHPEVRRMNCLGRLILVLICASSRGQEIRGMTWVNWVNWPRPTKRD